MNKRIQLVLLFCVAQNVCASIVQFDEFKKAALGYAQSAADSAHDVWATHPTACKAVLAGTAVAAVGTYFMWPRTSTEKKVVLGSVPGKDQSLATVLQMGAKLDDGQRAEAFVDERPVHQQAVGTWDVWNKWVTGLPLPQGMVLEKTIIVYQVLSHMKQQDLVASGCHALVYDQGNRTISWVKNDETESVFFRNNLRLDDEAARFFDIVTLIVIKNGGTREDEKRLNVALGLDVSLKRDQLTLEFLTRRMESIVSSTHEE